MTTPIMPFTSLEKRWATQTLHFRIDDVEIFIELDISNAQHIIPIKLIVDSSPRKFKLEF